MSRPERARSTQSGDVAAGGGLQRVVVVTGKRGRGKSTALAEAVGRLRGRGYDVRGFVQRVRYDGHGEVVGYDVEELRSGERVPLAELASQEEGEHGTRFSFRAEGFACAARAMEASRAPVLVVDEIGPVELEGEGHAPALRKVLEEDPPALLIVTVRPSLVPHYLSGWSAASVVVVRVDEQFDAAARIAEAAAELLAAP